MLANRSIPRSTVIPELAYPDVAQYAGKGDPTLPTHWKKARR